MVIALFVLISRFNLAKAISLTDVSVAITLKRLSVLLVAIFGGPLFQEKQLLFKTVISIIMIIGVYLLII